MHLLNRNQYISIQICCSLFCVILNRCFVIKESNPDLVHLLSYHIKYLVMLHISQFCHMITFERGRSGISHLHQSPCYPSSSMTFINLSISIWLFQEPRNNFQAFQPNFNFEPLESYKLDTKSKTLHNDSPRPSNTATLFRHTFVMRSLTLHYI